MSNVIEKLLKNPEDFDFFQVVKLLEEYALSYRLKHNISLVFPVSEVSKISKRDSHWEINTNVMGLVGPSGVLPNHHTALIIERLQHKDFALRNFLDIFQHRLVSLFYFTGQKKQAKNKQILLSLIGQGTPFLQNRENIPDQIMLYYAAHFSKHRHSVLGLESILSDYFNISVKVKTFQKKKIQISDTEQSQLSCFDINKFNQLGVDANCGRSQVQYQYHFELIIGPLDIEKFTLFLPDQKNLSLLIALTRRYVGIEYTFDVRLILKAESVPHCNLNGFLSSKLGWNSWLKIREFVSDADNTVLSIRSLS